MAEDADKKEASWAKMYLLVIGLNAVWVILFAILTYIFNQG